MTNKIKSAFEKAKINIPFIGTAGALTGEFLSNSATKGALLGIAGAAVLFGLSILFSKKKDTLKKRKRV